MNAAVGDTHSIVLPVYLLIDVSYSSQGYIQELRDGLDHTLHEFANKPLVADLVRLSVITFADDAQVDTPLTPLTEVRLPDLRPRGGTSFVAAFTIATATIKDDFRRLKSELARVYRPLVVFVTDGEPTDDWDGCRRALRELKGIAVTIVAVGVGAGIDATLLREVASAPGLAFVTHLNISPGEQWRAPAQLLTALLNSTSKSVRTAEKSVLGSVPPTLIRVSLSDDDDANWL